MISPNGKLVAVAANQSAGLGRRGGKVNVGLWHLETGKHLGDIPFDAIRIDDMEFSPGGRFLVSCATRAFGKSPTVVHDVKTGKPVTAFADGLSSATSLAFAPDGLSLATAHNDGTIYVWNTTD